MTALLATLRAQFDYVILDCPPILPVSDGRVISTLSDITVFVVQWRVTRRDAVGNAIKQLRKAGANIAGAVISRVDVHQHATYGYGDTDQYYGSYEGDYSNSSANET